MQSTFAQTGIFNLRFEAASAHLSSVETTLMETVHSQIGDRRKEGQCTGGIGTRSKSSGLGKLTCQRGSHELETKSEGGDPRTVANALKTPKVRAGAARPSVIEK